MRLIPYDDDDTLFQVEYLVIAPVDNHPIGPRHAATFARHWLEACDMVRNKFGAGLADRVQVQRVFTYDRETGVRRETEYYVSKAA
jgi:hypothetical protein